MLLQRPLCCALACSSYTCVVNSQAELLFVFVFCVVSVDAWRVVLYAGGSVIHTRPLASIAAPCGLHITAVLHLV
jgi:hypothetical protein